MAIDSVTLIFHVNILIIALVTLFALSTLPRALARFSSAAEWKHGHILRSVRLGTDVEPFNEKNIASQAAGFASSISIMSEDSHTDLSHANLHLHSSIRNLGSVPKHPPHVCAWSAMVPSLGSFLRKRLAAGFSLGQALVLGVYAALLSYASFYGSNPFEDPLRMGFVAMSQIPVVYILGTKNNVIGMCVGMGYEKLNYIHRFAGLMMILLANIHSMGYIYKWTFERTFAANMKVPSNRMALGSLIALDVLYFFSTAFWRRKAYNIFITTHVICFIAFPLLVCAHNKTMLYYVLPAVAAYGLDRIVRLFKTRISSARLQPIPDLSLTRVEIPALNSGWRAGQHVRIRVLSSGMGLIGWAEEHPFTIASVAKTQDGLVLMCKNAGGWTKRLYELAKVAGYGCEDSVTSRSITVMLEGPYGGPGHSVFTSFSAAMFVVGGSGITFALSAIQDLIQKDRDGSSRVKLIELIWSIQDPTALDPLMPLFGSLIQRNKRVPLQISVHYTRATDVPPAKDFLPPGLTLTAGRPRTAKVLDSVIARVVSYGSDVKAHTDMTGVVVGVCGPVGIGDEVSRAVSSLDAGKRWAVGGVEIHEETFGW